MRVTRGGGGDMGDGAGQRPTFRSLWRPNEEIHLCCERNVGIFIKNINI